MINYKMRERLPLEGGKELELVTTATERGLSE